ncbi:hypothetical protein BDV41DRAFT_579934 [Aspergillus transmontanensis]|uniref:Major facilitator superfamily domain-containing protein n=1 Tax=Aspergillus transmontanensis TaxID=1034304 RepID=A0A5N6VNE2_9EURO|nr:hypothetical protein BDV41DRAFT_579934 [Aspergillus transmontanensis]
MKYDKPARAERQSQASRMMAWWMTVGVEWPTRNLKIMSRSNSILIMNLLELITNGTSGSSNACVDEDKAASTAENKCRSKTSGALLIFFVLWQSFQERCNKPTLIRNSLWKNVAFTCICVNVFMIWGALNTFEQVINIFFQNVQHLSGVETAIRFIPTPITGLLIAFTTRFVLHTYRADVIINITTLIPCVSPLIMALVNPARVYWRCASVAISLNSIAADSLFTVSNNLIAGVSPAEMQGLAACVFNTVSHIEKSFGLVIVALISNQVTDQQSQFEDKRSPEALMVGYRAAFWTLFGMNVASLVLSLFGLRKVGNIGKQNTQ